MNDGPDGGVVHVKLLLLSIFLFGFIIGFCIRELLIQLL